MRAKLIYASLTPLGFFRMKICVLAHIRAMV